MSLPIQSKTKRTIFFLGLFFFFMSGTFYVMKDFKQFQLYALLIGIALIWMTSGFLFYRSGREGPFRGEVLSVLYVLFSFSTLFSLFANREYSIIKTFLGLLLILWCCVVLIPECCNRYNVSLNSIYLLLMASFWIIFLYSALRYGIRTVNYEGAFRNQNGLGASATTLFCIASACFLDNFKRETDESRGKVLWICGLSMLFSMLMALFATSRTSVITILFCFVISIIILLIQGLDRRYSARVLVLLVFVLVLFLFLYSFTSFRGVVERFLYKFSLKQDDQLNGRQELWDIILNRLSLFGNGEDSSIAAHNTYLSMIDQYGLISGAIWCLFCISGIIISLAFLFKTKSESFKHLPLLAFVVFSLQSLAEGMMLKTIMLVAVFSIPIINYGKSFIEGKAESVKDEIRS